MDSCLRRNDGRMGMAQVAEMVERVLELRGGVFRRAFGEAACEGGASRSAGVAREPPPQSLSDSSPALRGGAMGTGAGASRPAEQAP